MVPDYDSLQQENTKDFLSKGRGIHRKKSSSA
jgi:hypothetical protein